MKNFFTKTSLLGAFLLLMGSYSFAQTPDPYLFDDFEPGSINSFGVCTDQVNTSLPPIGWNHNGTVSPAIVSNPNPVGLNTSPTVMYYYRGPADVAWAGPKINDGEWGTAFADTWGGVITGYNYLHIEMYSNVINAPGVNTGGADAEPMNGSDILPNTWVDVVFDLSSYPVLSMIAILVDQNTLTQQSDVYLDNIILSNDPTPRTASSGIKNVAANSVTIYAANGSLHISGSNDAVTVYNAMGRTVYQNTSAQNLSVDLAKGMYIVKVGDTAKKILVQ